MNNFHQWMKKKSKEALIYIIFLPFIRSILGKQGLIDKGLTIFFLQEGGWSRKEPRNCQGLWSCSPRDAKATKVGKNIWKLKGFFFFLSLSIYLYLSFPFSISLFSFFLLNFRCAKWEQFWKFLLILLKCISLNFDN